MKGHFLAPSAVHIKHRRSWKPRMLLKQTQRLSILPKRTEEAGVLLPGEPDNAQLRDHDRPAED
jgi:hypothetical protein